MQATLVFDKVTKVYGRDSPAPLVAIDRIDLEVSSNEVYCLVGPSGCGKTTLLNLAAGFSRVTNGRVLVAGREVSGPHSRCGVAFQGDAVFPWMTVAQNVSYGLRWNGTSSDDRAAIVDRYLRRVGLELFADRWPRELSGGMRKRVDLARMFAFNSPIQLLDEPFGSLDVLTKAEMQRVLLEAWKSEPKTVLFITHDVEEAVFLGHRVGVMSSSPGRVAQEFRIPYALEDRRSELKLSTNFIEIRRDIVRVLERHGSLGRVTEAMPA